MSKKELIWFYSMIGILFVIAMIMGFTFVDIPQTPETPKYLSEQK